MLKTPNKQKGLKFAKLNVGRHSRLRMLLNYPLERRDSKSRGWSPYDRAINA